MAVKFTPTPSTGSRQVQPPCAAGNPVRIKHRLDRRPARRTGQAPVQAGAEDELIQVTEKVLSEGRGGRER